jgi:hypothetical protein
MLAGSVLLGAAPPKIESIFPLGGQPGATVQAVVRGADLAGAYDLFFEEEGIQARVIGVEAEKASGAPSKNRKPTDLLRLELRFSGSISGASRPFRVLTPRGVSNALSIHVHDEPAQFESEQPHDLPRQAQALPRIPAAVHGHIAEVGEVDYYSFRAAAGEELSFRTLSSSALDPALAIYKLTGSWFDPDRATRLAFNDEPVAYPDLTIEAAVTYRFAEAGDYLVRVNGFWGHGGAGQDYLLLIAPAGRSARRASEPAAGWSERTWIRPLSQERMKTLWARALPHLGSNATAIPVIDADAEPTKFPVEPPTIPIPALITGTIERPGDVDRVRFSAKAGDRVVFEVETPEVTIPHIHPLLRIIDADGVEALTNILSMVNANGNISKQIYPKTEYSFPRAGEFTLEIRDINSSYGDRRMRYRVLLRPQVPHLGAVHVNDDCLNLVAGKAQKLSIVTDQEEGFDGYVILSMEGLPEGIRVVTATEVEPDSPPETANGKRERFRAKNQKATLLLVPDAGAPLTRSPVVSRVYAQPVVKGELGDRILIKEIPVMLVKGGD